jgi:hypothetical protein
MERIALSWYCERTDTITMRSWSMNARQEDFILLDENPYYKSHIIKIECRALDWNNRNTSRNHSYINPFNIANLCTCALITNPKFIPPHHNLDRFAGKDHRKATCRNSSISATRKLSRRAPPKISIFLCLKLGGDKTWLPLAI